MRIALEVGAVLEGAGLALVDVHRHQPRRRLLAHDAPLAPGRKARAAEAAQARVLHRLEHGLGVLLAVDQRGRERVAAVGAVGGVVGEGGQRSATASGGGVTLCSAKAEGTKCAGLRAAPAPIPAPAGSCPRRHRHGALVHRRGRRLLAAADAGRRDHAHVLAARRAQQRGQPRQQVLRAGQLAGQAVAHAHRERRAPARRRAGSRSGDRRSRPRRPRPSGCSSARPAPPGAGRAGRRQASLSRCRCSISRSRR